MTERVDSRFSGLIMLPVPNMENSNDLEEKLREAACVGDLESVKTLIESSNVQINGQNKVNGW